MSELLFQQWVGTPKSVSGFPRIDFPLLTDLPILGEIFFNHNLLVYVAFALVPISAFVLNNTTFGLMIRAVGQNPEAADAMGVSVARVRYATTTIGGMLAGLAGASLSIALINLFQQNLTAGQGFIAVALVYFGGWRPWTVAAGAMLFSFVNALQLQIKVIGADIPLRIRRHGALRDHDHRPGFRHQAARAADGVDQTLRARGVALSFTTENTEGTERLIEEES